MRRPSLKNSLEIAIGGAAQITIISGPVLYSVTRADDGRVEFSSMKPWKEHNFSQMHMCVSLDDACQLSPSDWKPFAEEQQIEERGLDWVTPTVRRGRDRDIQGNLVLSIGQTYQEPQPISQAAYTITGFWDKNTPLENLPAPVQTSVAATQSAYPLSGSVVWEGGRCCAGGLAGETIDLQEDSNAESLSGEVTEMRTTTGGMCFDEDELSGVAWEPFTANKTYPVRVALNWVGHYISVQYRDERGNLSPVYCDDISVEGSPGPSPNP